MRPYVLYNRKKYGGKSGIDKKDCEVNTSYSVYCFFLNISLIKSFSKDIIQLSVVTGKQYIFTDIYFTIGFFIEISHRFARFECNYSSSLSKRKMTTQ